MGRGQRLPEQPKYRNTRLLVSTVEALKKHGTKGETYDQIIERLLSLIPESRSLPDESRA